MARGALLLVTLGLLSASLAGCGGYDQPKRPAWRDQAEEACLAQHSVEPSEWIKPSQAIEGPGICGLNHPFRVYALAGGTVRLSTASLLDCSMIPMLDAWIKDVVQPDALARFGEPVVQINTMGTYSCRGINNARNTKLSEHAFANAMDIGGFVLASGREINVMRGWAGADVQESAFLRDGHAGACTYFTTVLGPGANIFHYNHVHMDLAKHGTSRHATQRYCKPVPDAVQVAAPSQGSTPEQQAAEEEQDASDTPPPPQSYRATASADLMKAVDPLSTSHKPSADASTIHPATPDSSAFLATRPRDPGQVDHRPSVDGAFATPEGVPADWDIAR